MLTHPAGGDARARAGMSEPRQGARHRPGLATAVEGRETQTQRERHDRAAILRLLAVDPYADNIVTFSHLRGGYDAACMRFWQAAEDSAQNRGFSPLFEALHWAVALDERVAAHWAPEGTPLGWKWRQRFENGFLMRGVRFVRNSVHHQWSDALTWKPPAEVTPAAFDPRQDAFGFPVPTAAALGWVWREAPDLPEANRPDPAGQAIYDEHMSGRPASLTLVELQRVFSTMWHFLEGPRLFPDPSKLVATPPEPASHAPTDGGHISETGTPRTIRP